MRKWMIRDSHLLKTLASFWIHRVRALSLEGKQLLALLPSRGLWDKTAEKEIMVINLSNLSVPLSVPELTADEMRMAECEWLP